MGLLLSIPQHRRELFSRLLDGDHMLAVLQRELPALAGEPVRVSACKVRVGRSRTVLSQETLRVTYKVQAAVGQAAEREYVLLGTAPVRLEDQDPSLLEHCRSLVGHEAVVPFQKLFAYVPDLMLALHFFPADPAMPALGEVTGPPGKALLAGYLGLSPDVVVERYETELKHYKAFNRAVLRVTLGFSGAEQGERSVYVKLFSDERGEQGYRPYRALWEASRQARSLRVPEPMAYDEKRLLLVMSEATGKPELTHWIRCIESGEPLPDGVGLERVRAAMTATAEALAELQACPLVLDQIRGFAGELRQLGKDKRLLEGELLRREPALVGRALALYGRLEALAPAPGTEEFVPAHGGFRHKQMVGNERCLTIIDWDGLCLASPAFDAAKFLARLHQEGVLAPGSCPTMDALAEHFRDAFLARVPRATPRELDLYEALVCTERTLRAFRRAGNDERQVERIHSLAAAAEQLLDRVEAAS